jgi:hypothetical protein
MDTDPRDKVLEYVKKKYYAKLGYTNEEVELDEASKSSTAKPKFYSDTMKKATKFKDRDVLKMIRDEKARKTKMAKEEVALDEVVTKRKMTSKELVARAAYLAKHKEKMAAADTGIKATKSYKDISGERGDYTSEPSKMKSAPKSSSKYLDIKEDKPPFPGPYEKKGEAKDKNVAKNMARKAMKAAVEKAKSKKK